MTMSDRAPDLIEPIVAWRGWGVNEVGSTIQLLSMNGTEWPPRGELEANCRTRGHAPPGTKCRCGIYAAKSLDHLREIGYNGLGVIGEVALAGEVVEGELGYRAARAWPVKLYVPHTRWRWAKPLGRAYDVPAVLLNPYEGGIH
jgi:hypothetical protein